MRVIVQTAVTTEQGCCVQYANSSCTPSPAHLGLPPCCCCATSGVEHHPFPPPPISPSPPLPLSSHVRSVRSITPPAPLTVASDDLAVKAKNNSPNLSFQRPNKHFTKVDETRVTRHASFSVIELPLLTSSLKMSTVWRTTHTHTFCSFLSWNVCIHTRRWLGGEWECRGGGGASCLKILVKRYGNAKHVRWLLSLSLSLSLCSQ